MKQPNSPLPWRIEIEEEEMSTSELTPDKAYFVLSSKPQEIEGADSKEPILSNRRYYNSAPEELQDAEYIVEACNNYPKAIELLQDCLSGYWSEGDTQRAEEIEKFLNSIK